MSQNLIEKAFIAYERHQRARGVETDEVSFVAGMMSCFGILTGRIPVGLPEDTPILKLFDLIQAELDGYRNKVVAAQGKENA